MPGMVPNGWWVQQLGFSGGGSRALGTGDVLALSVVLALYCAGVALFCLGFFMAMRQWARDDAVRERYYRRVAGYRD